MDTNRPRATLMEGRRGNTPDRINLDKVKMVILKRATLLGKVDLTNTTLSES
jgi:hypothetical protein